MEIKLFGKNLFSYQKGYPELLYTNATESSAKDKFLPDFYQKMGSSGLSDYVVMEEVTFRGNVAVPTKKKKAEKKPVPKNIVKMTPKGVHELKLLNDETFKLNTDPTYVDNQLSEFKDKLTLINSQEYDMRNGVAEISSTIMRLENRKKYSESKEFFEQYPYTKTTRIAEVIKKHDYLRLGNIGQFVAELPKDAVEVMKSYDKECDKLCGKKAIFYLIADKADFKKTDQRRDPILLAQSPFGHFWQILGAWDKEMMFLEEL